MKKIFVAMMAMAALAACSNEETLSFDKEAIGFSNAFVNNSVRSIDSSLTKDTLQGFLVYGTTKGNHDGAQVVNIFENTLVEKVSENVWNYAANLTQYWIAGNTYNFAAVVNANTKEDLNAENVATDDNGMPATLTYTADGKTDLLYAYNGDIEGLVSENPAVAFTFDHLLSKVKFSFFNESAADTNVTYTYRVSNVTMKGSYGKATCDVSAFPTYTWAEVANSTKATTTYGNIVATPAEGETQAENADAIKIASQKTYFSNYENLVIPGTYDVNIKCTIELLIGDAVVDIINYDKTASVTLAGGVAYNFVLKGKVGEPIKFTVNKVQDWNNPAEVVPTPAVPAQ